MNLRGLILFLACMSWVCYAPLTSVSAGKDDGGDILINLTNITDVNRVDVNGMTRLHHAAKQGKLSIAQYLICNLHADVSKKDNFGMTPLHYAAKFGRSVTVRWLLTSGGAMSEVNTQDDEGRTPLHYAVSLPNADAAKYLIEIGYADVHIRDKLGNEPTAYIRWNNMYIIRGCINSSKKPFVFSVPHATSTCGIIESGALTDPICPIVHMTAQRDCEPVKTPNVPPCVLPTVCVGKNRPNPDILTDVLPNISSESTCAISMKPSLPTEGASKNSSKPDEPANVRPNTSDPVASSEISYAALSDLCVNSKRRRIDATENVSSIVSTPNGGSEGHLLPDVLTPQTGQMLDKTTGRTCETAPLNSGMLDELPLNSDVYPYYDYDVNYYVALYPSLLLPEHRDFLV